jgi:regulatory protein
MEEQTPKKGPTAYVYALALLAGQDYSEYKLRQKMRLKGYGGEELDEALARLKEKNYLREGEYKKLLAKKLMRKGQADGLVKRRLEQEHLQIDATELGELREDCGVAQEDALTQLVAKKLRGQPWPAAPEQRQKLQAKVYRFLLSRGYSYQDAKRALAAATALPDSDE